MSSSSTTAANADAPPRPRPQPQPQPRTHGSLSLLLVGVNGKRGALTLAGILANRHRLSWVGPHGGGGGTNGKDDLLQANYDGCLTQKRTGSAGTDIDLKSSANLNDALANIAGLADASMAALGGWDVTAAKPGEALADHRIVDWDLARQLRPIMDEVKVFRGYYDGRFVNFDGKKKKEQETEAPAYVLTEREAPTASEALKSIRADIRYFKWRNGVVGHTTVVWSATDEVDCPLCRHGGGLDTAANLLQAIELSDEERGGPLPPSLLYATAALLEGCSFANGGSQNTLCEGLIDLSRQQRGVYCLGSDLRATRSKLEAGVADCMNSLGLEPSSIANANACATHAVSDETTRVMEVTSAGFLHQAVTMLTHSRASDPVFCASSIIDTAIWCDYFSNRSWPADDVAKAMAYLFREPQNDGIDGAAGNGGLLEQLDTLRAQVIAADRGSKSKKRDGGRSGRKVRIRAEQDTGASSDWTIPDDASIICAGLACVDMQLNQATGGDGGEAIETFQGEKSIGGGSVSMACKTLARLTWGSSSGSGSDDMEVASPAVHSVIPLCKIGKDHTGQKLVSLLEDCGSASRNVDTKFMRAERDRDPSARTALAVLPIYQDGRRGCFFDAASNATFSADQLLVMTHDTAAQTDAIGAFLFGYPHLLPLIQGNELARVFSKARALMEDGGITALDLNGVPESNSYRTTIRSVADLEADPVLGPALPHVDILHMNEDELINLTGCTIEGSDASQLEDEFNIASAVSLFLMCGVAIVAVTRGKAGCFISCNDADRFARSKALPSSWADCTTKVGVVNLPPGTQINTNGAGDSFTSGLLLASLLRRNVPTSESQQKSPLLPKAAVAPMTPVSAPSTTSTSADQLSKMTPYRLYMKEHYISLKTQCHDDKRAIFARCHEMWENEPESVKSKYSLMLEEQIARAAQGSDGQEADENDTETSFSRTFDAASAAGAYLTKREEAFSETSTKEASISSEALQLESAAQLATLIAAHHIDMSTRDSDRIDLGVLLERSTLTYNGLEEI